MATNTTKSINQAPETTEKDLELQVKQAAEMLKGEKLVEVSIPKHYVKAIGPTLFLGINGVNLVLPVDGSKHQIPKSYKEHLDEYLNNLTV